MLTTENLADIVHRVFIERISTLLTESGGYQVTDFIDTCLELRKLMYPCLEQLPASTYEPDPGRKPGEEAGWTAGEIVSTNSDRLVWALEQAALTAEIRDLPPPPKVIRDNAAYEPQLLDQDTAIEVLRATCVYFKEVFPLVLSADNGQTAARTHHGEMSVASWLLLICIHDDDHLRQLRSRRDTVKR